jgi:outer membrane protein
MKKVILTISLLILGFCIIPAILSAGPVKIVIFDFQKIIDKSDIGKTTQKRLMNKGKEFQQKLQAEKNKLDAMNKAYENEKLVLSPAKKSEKEVEMRNRITDFRRLQSDLERQFKQLEMESLNKIQKKVIKIAKELGKQNQYTLILERKAAGVIYFSETIDITDSIIAKYNRKTKKNN